MRKQIVTVIAALAALQSLALSSAQAMEYFELEVYPYQTASEGEKEIENFTSYSQGTGDQSIFRSSFEFNYGLNDRWELAAYLDLARPSGESLSWAGTRVRTRTRFFEKGELPVDFGAYAELAFPRHENTQMEGELRGIIEKDFGFVTVTLNPILERVLKSEVEGEESGEIELNYAASLSYRWNETFRPHVDFFGEPGEEDSKHLVSPALDLRIGNGWKAQARLAFGLTPTTEKRLVGLRLEYEF